MKRIRIGSGLSKLLAPLGVALALAAAPAAQAEEDLVLGGSIPLSGVFAFAGQGIHAGITDYVKIVNDQGGIKGRKLRYVPEDTAYKVDASVAAFKKITSQNKVNFYYGDSTGFSKTINAELNRSGNILMTGASFATELNDPAKYPAQFMLGPDLLIAPVMYKDQRSRSVYLPAGAAWLDAWTLQEYAGGQAIEADAPIERIPVFWRKGSQFTFKF